MSQVGRNGVAPAHVSPLIAERVELKEEMVLAVEQDGAIGIVDPIGRSIKVNLRLPGGGWTRRLKTTRRRLAEDLCDKDDCRDKEQTERDLRTLRSEALRGHL